MFYVYFTRRYSKYEMVAECRSDRAAFLRANEELANGSRDIVVVSETGLKIYEPEEEFLVDEF